MLKSNRKLARSYNAAVAAQPVFRDKVSGIEGNTRNVWRGMYRT